MTDIRYLIGDATAPTVTGPKYIAHVCNDIGGWGRGFVLALSHRWKGPERAYRQWSKEGAPTFGLGQVQFVPVTADITVANMVAQHGVRVTSQGGTRQIPLRYDALRQCLDALGVEAQRCGASVHMPRIGCGLAGGTWDRVEPLLIETLAARDIPVFVYDLA